MGLKGNAIVEVLNWRRKGAGTPDESSVQKPSDYGYPER